MNPSPITFEVCIDSVEGAVAAKRGGADRLELCSALSEGGITPSYGLVQRVVATVDLPVMMMIRCRGGSFVYSDQELDVMLHDIEIAKTIGVHGVVFGILRDDDQIQLEANQQLIQAARPLEVTFHRAFDEPAVDAQATIVQLQNLGITRLLTSGQKDSAAEGVELIANLVKQSERVSIMPGAGVRPENAKGIIQATNAREIHGTASRFCDSRQRKVTCEETVRAIRTQLDGI